MYNPVIILPTYREGIVFLSCLKTQLVALLSSVANLNVSFEAKMKIYTSKMISIVCTVALTD